MLRPVCWPREDAHSENGVKKVTVILWDDEAKGGKARIDNYGPQVEVFLPDYAEGNLTIGVRQADKPTQHQEESGRWEHHERE